MKFLVLGGGGFIGSAVVDRLLQEKQSVRIFEQAGVSPRRIFNPHEEVDWVTGDFSNPSDVRNALEGIEFVIHLVSTVVPKSSNQNPLYDIESNLMGSVALLTAAVEAGVKKILFVSSGGTIYGKPVDLPIRENHPTDPICSYGVVKLAIEKYLGLFYQLYGLDYSILRISNPFGEGQKSNSGQGAVAVFLDKALKGKPIEIWGDGSVTRDYLYISDLADAFSRALFYDGPERVFNISSGQGTSLNQLVELIEGVLGQSVERIFHPARSFDVPVNILSNQLAREELGWSPKVQMRDGIVLTAAWMTGRSA